MFRQAEILGGVFIYCVGVALLTKAIAYIPNTCTDMREAMAMKMIDTLLQSLIEIFFTISALGASSAYAFKCHT